MDIPAIEYNLKQLKSVDYCKILLDENDEIKEIHITSGSDRSPKQVSRDIQSVLISQFGLEVDYKKISVAQIRSSTCDSKDIRLKVKSIEYSVDEMKVYIKVTLEKDDIIYYGQSQGPYTANNVLRLLAIATLRAVENCFDSGEMFVLEEITNISISGKNIIFAVVNALFGDKEQILCGSAFVQNDNKETAVKATLDAVNRVLARIP